MLSGERSILLLLYSVSFHQLAGQTVMSWVPSSAGHYFESAAHLPWGADKQAIISPVVFRAIRCSRNVKLWNRQASIIRELTTLGHFVTRSVAFRAYEHRRSYESVGTVHGRVHESDC
jgi:hypothetical protein